MSLHEIFEQTSSAKEDVESYTLHGVNVNVIPSDKEFAEKLFDSLASIPTGRQALADMAEHQTGFYLESSLAEAGGFFSPDDNQIVMAKALGMDFMEFATVHEARHLVQHVLGRDEAESKPLDYASQLMINRATEADAQAQAIKACKEWEAQGHTAPLERFNKHYPPIVNAYNKNQSLSDAFKGWYDDERICASYEKGYDVLPALTGLAGKPVMRPFIALEPADIKHFCGADRVEGFEDFLKTEQARKVHVSTKAAMECADIANVGKGGKHDASIAACPVRELEGNPAATMYAAKNAKDVLDKFTPLAENAKTQVKGLFYQSAVNAFQALSKMDEARAKGQIDIDAEQALKDEKIYLYLANRIRGNTCEKIADLPGVSENVSKRIKADADALCPKRRKFVVPMEKRQIEKMLQSINGSAPDAVQRMVLSKKTMDR